MKFSRYCLDSISLALALCFVFNKPPFRYVNYDLPRSSESKAHNFEVFLSKYLLSSSKFYYIPASCSDIFGFLGNSYTKF